MTHTKFQGGSEHEPFELMPRMLFKNIKTGKVMAFSRRFDITKQLDVLGFSLRDAEKMLVMLNAYAGYRMCFDLEFDNGKYYLVIS